MTLNSKIGVIVAASYLALFGIASAAVAVSKPDAMSGLGLFFLTAPWSFILFDALHDTASQGAITGSPAFFWFLLAACALANAAIVFFLASTVSRIVAAIRENLS